MMSREQTREETYRLVVTRRNASEILLVGSASGWSLPSVQVSQQRRIAEQLCAELDAHYGYRGYCLLTRAHGTEVRGSAVMEVPSLGEPARAGTCWKSLDAGIDSSRESAEDRKITQELFDQLDFYRREPSQGPFARPGWLDDLVEWAEQQLRPSRIRLTGGFVQHNASPTFSLIRFETNRSALWFKAVGDPNGREFPITLKVAELFPRYVPSIVATRSDLNGWLSTEADGHTLGPGSGLQDWSRAAESLAVLQTQSIKNANQFLALGAHDLRLGSLALEIGPMFSAIGELMAHQEKKSPAPLGSPELQWLSGQIKLAIEQLDRFAIPDTLGHLDLNPGNIVVNDSRATFLDWAEAYVGPPTLSFSYLLEHFGRLEPRNSLNEKCLASVYGNASRPCRGRQRISEILTLSSLLAVFAYATKCPGWRDMDSLLGDATASGFFRGLARRMYREATLLEGGRSMCSN